MNIKPHALLSAYTTFQLGGPCPCLIECATPDELIQTVQKLKKENTPFLLIGGGSNMVVSDHGLNTTVIRYLSPTPLIERKAMISPSLRALSWMIWLFFAWMKAWKV